MQNCQVLTHLNHYLSQKLGQAPEAVQTIPAGFVVSYLDEFLSTAPQADITVDSLIALIETHYASQLKTAHWETVVTALRSDPRYPLHSEHFLPLRASLLQPEVFTGGRACGAFSEGVSLGAFCHAAEVLKTLGVRKRSGPFDWIFFNVRALVHCLNDEFETFMCADHFQTVPEADRVVKEANRCQHVFYREKFGVQFMFNHHDLTQPEHLAHYQRAVAGFNAVFDSQQPVLFLMMSVADCAEPELQALADAMKKRGGLQHTVVLRLKNTIEPEAAPTVLWRSEQLVYVEFPVGSASNGTQFKDSSDNLRLQTWLKALYFGGNGQ